MLAAGPTPSTRIDLIITTLAVTFFYFLLFKFPAQPFFMQGDQFIFMENAERMLRGEAIYRDFFQFTFPGGQVLYVVLFAIFGVKYWVLGLATMLMGFGFFWSLLRVSRGLIDSPMAYLPPTLFVFFGFRWFGPDGSHRSFGLLLAFLAVWALIGRTSAKMLIMAGVLCGLSSFFTQQRGGQMLAALVVFAVVDTRLSEGPGTKCLRSAGVLIASYAFSLSALCAYFVYTSGIERFIWSTIVYPAKYYGYHEQNNVGTFLLEIEKAYGLGNAQALYVTAVTVFYSLAVPLVTAIFFLLFLKIRRRHPWGFWRAPLLLAIASAALIVGTPNPNGIRYFQLAAPALILFGWMIEYSGVLRQRVAIAVTTVAAALIVVSGLQIYRLQTHWDYLDFETPTGMLAVIVDDGTRHYVWLRDNTTAGDHVYEVNNPYLNFPLGLRNPARFSQVFPTDYTRPEQVASVVEDLQARPPKFIYWNNSYNKPADQRAAGDHTGPLADHIQAEYVPVGDIYDRGTGPMQFWAKK